MVHKGITESANRIEKIIGENEKIMIEEGL
jgi:hypothetical protein